MAIALIVGWGIFVIVAIFWSLSYYLQKATDRDSRAINRNTIYLIIFVLVNVVVGVVLLGVSKDLGPQIGLDDFVFALCIISPAIIFGIFMTRVAERKRLRLLEKQMSEQKDKPDK
jgi:cation transporter-like permease